VVSFSEQLGRKGGIWVVDGWMPLRFVDRLTFVADLLLLASTWMGDQRLGAGEHGRGLTEG
jgi:hypothetical protein